MPGERLKTTGEEQTGTDPATTDVINDDVEELGREERDNTTPLDDIVNNWG